VTSSGQYSLSSSAGAIKILDFGLAKLLHEGDEKFGGETIRERRNLLTSPGLRSAPSRTCPRNRPRGEELDGRSDLFSLGAVHLPS